MKLVSGYSMYPREALLEDQHLEACHYSTYPPSHFLESWRKGMFLMELEMVSWYLKYPREALLKVSLKSNIRKEETSRAGMLLMEIEIGLEKLKISL